MKQINQMLLEMASGNFFYRLERSAKNDNLESIGISLNMLAEEIQEAMVHQGYANTNGIMEHIVQMSFILNSDGRIQTTNQKACTILSILYSDIINKLFEVFLIETSQNKWRDTWKLLQQKDFYDTSLELTFKTKGDLIIPNPCYITTFKDKITGQRSTLITVIHHSNAQNELETDLKRRVIQFKEHQTLLSKDTPYKSQKQKLRLSFEDIRKLREGRNIIINNLDKELPSLKDFALLLGTNEFKLKYGFKELYGTSVYRFLKLERLRKSKMLVQYSGLPLKSITHMTEFKSISHFSRTFKKHYGYAPSTLRKKVIKGQ
tara:strand:+ start:1009 stop:1965 length:957 start_codon:yes stop_codon:yes gene_type:complete